MPKLSVVSGLRVVKDLTKMGYKIDHQTGSHIILRQQKKHHRRLAVPKHKEIYNFIILKPLNENKM